MNLWLMNAQKLWLMLNTSLKLFLESMVALSCSKPRCWHCSHRNSRLRRFEALLAMIMSPQATGWNLSSVALKVFLHMVMGIKRKMQLRCCDMEWWMKWRQLPFQPRPRVHHFEHQRWAAMGGKDEMQLSGIINVVASVFYDKDDTIEDPKKDRNPLFGKEWSDAKPIIVPIVLKIAELTLR